MVAAKKPARKAGSAKAPARAAKAVKVAKAPKTGPAKSGVAVPKARRRPPACV